MEGRQVRERERKKEFYIFDFQEFRNFEYKYFNYFYGYILLRNEFVFVIVFKMFG